MPNALIGHTGFVGGNLRRQYEFQELYNSKNIDAIAHQQFELLVCAGAPGAKWKANQNPAADKEAIVRLIEPLKTVQAERFVLISTVDVYGSAVGVDEETPIRREGLHPYGVHRLELEEFVKDSFPAIIIRLPGLFGEGLKKNVIFDFLHKHDLHMIHQDGVLQFYNLEALWGDVKRTQKAELSLVNFATEPVSVRAIAREAFGFEFENSVETVAPKYNMKTRHAKVWGREDGYLYSAAEVLVDLKSFVARYKTRDAEP